MFVAESLIFPYIILCHMIRGVNNSFEGRMGLGIFRNFKRFFEDFWGVFGDFMGIIGDFLGFFGIFGDFLRFFSQKCTGFFRVIVNVDRIKNLLKKNRHQ